MIDFEQAMADQDDVEALCSQSFPRREPFVSNESYGFDIILKEYSGYPKGRPIQAVIPHGVYLSSIRMLELELDSGLPAVLNYPAYRSRVWEEETAIEIIPSASPFLYALSMFRDGFAKRVDAKGTIFFPAHSRPFASPNVRWNELAQELAARDDLPEPVTVCMHRWDIEEGAHKPFTRSNMRVVSAGSGTDPDFTYRWLHLVSAHERAASNDVGSSMIYAAQIGMETQLVGRMVEHFTDPALWTLQVGKDTSQAEETKRRLVELFRDTTEGASARLAEVAGYLLGAENMKTREELRADLEHAAALADADPAPSGIQ